MSAITEFNDGVLSAFEFLTSELGFRSVVSNPNSSVESVIFEKLALVVEIVWYKWNAREVNVRIRVAIDTLILRPYRTKSFDLCQVVRHLKKDAFQVRPALPERTLSVADALTHVRFCAELMKVHCREILRGDLKALEEMVQADSNQWESWENPHPEKHRLN